MGLKGDVQKEFLVLNIRSPESFPPITPKRGTPEKEGTLVSGPALCQPSWAHRLGSCRRISESLSVSRTCSAGSSTPPPQSPHLHISCQHPRPSSPARALLTCPGACCPHPYPARLLAQALIPPLSERLHCLCAGRSAQDRPRMLPLTLVSRGIFPSPTHWGKAQLRWSFQPLPQLDCPSGVS